MRKIAGTEDCYSNLSTRVTAPSPAGAGTGEWWPEQSTCPRGPTGASSSLPCGPINALHMVPSRECEISGSKPFKVFCPGVAGRKRRYEIKASRKDSLLFDHWFDSFGTYFAS